MSMKFEFEFEVFGEKYVARREGRDFEKVDGHLCSFWNVAVVTEIGNVHYHGYYVRRRSSAKNLLPRLVFALEQKVRDRFSDEALVGRYAQ